MHAATEMGEHVLQRLGDRYRMKYHLQVCDMNVKPIQLRRPGITFWSAERAVEAVNFLNARFKSKGTWFTYLREKVRTEDII